MKNSLLIFFLALVLNVIWENLHSLLYSSYMGGRITELILIRASLFDALLITLIVVPFIYLRALRHKDWLIVIVGICIAILNEWYGLGTDRWAYNALMPVIPFLNVGLTPTLQLGILGYLSFKLVYKSRFFDQPRNGRV